jgi:hypothetical protein
VVNHPVATYPETSYSGAPVDSLADLAHQLPTRMSHLAHSLSTPCPILITTNSGPPQGVSLPTETRVTEPPLTTPACRPWIRSIATSHSPCHLSLVPQLLLVVRREVIPPVHSMATARPRFSVTGHLPHLLALKSTRIPRARSTAAACHRLYRAEATGALSHLLLLAVMKITSCGMPRAISESRRRTTRTASTVSPKPPRNTPVSRPRIRPMTVDLHPSIAIDPLSEAPLLPVKRQSILP